MIALCGVFSGMELAIIYLSSVFQMLDLTIAALTVAFTLVLLAEYGKKPTFFVYAAVSVLSLLIVPNKFTPICYVLLFGIYPIVKQYFDRTGKVLSLIFKFAAFNAVYMIIYAVSVRFLLLDDIAGIGGVCLVAYLVILFVIKFYLADNEVVVFFFNRLGSVVGDG